MATIVSIIGTRPEIIKMAPVIEEVDKLNHEHLLVHSGQHYDLMMDEIFFKELGLRDPDYQFEVRDLPPHKQIASTINSVGEVVSKADLVIVQGDTNTTLAGAVLANKLGKALGHVEAGMRSFDKTMPEEINRILTDHLSTLLFAPTPISKENLEHENVREGVHVCGNTGVDAVLHNIAIAEKRSKVIDELGLTPHRYFTVTFHRTENADNCNKLRRVLLALASIAEEHGMPVVFPLHPRTKRRIDEFNLQGLLDADGLRVIEPIGYFDMLKLEQYSSLVLTDSGGLQEESCVLHVPCVTLRENTERPETLEIGCNILVGTNKQRLERAVRKQLKISTKWTNPYGDGTTGKQIARLVDKFLKNRGTS